MWRTMESQTNGRRDLWCKEIAKRHRLLGQSNLDHARRPWRRYKRLASDLSIKIFFRYTFKSNQTKKIWGINKYLR